MNVDVCRFLACSVIRGCCSLLPFSVVKVTDAKAVDSVMCDAYAASVGRRGAHAKATTESTAGLAPSNNRLSSAFEVCMRAMVSTFTLYAATSAPACKKHRALTLWHGSAE